MSSPRPATVERRQAILAAASEEFCAHGYEQATVGGIAARVGVVEGTVYRYFDSKHELLIEVLSDWYQSMFSDYGDALTGVNGAENRLRVLIWRHLRTIRDAPQLCRLMFREARDDVGEANALLRKLNRRYTRFLVEVIDEGAKSGEFRDQLRLPLVRDLIFGGVEHYCWRYLSGLESNLDVDQAARDICDIFLRGIEHSETGNSAQVQQLDHLIQRLEKLPQLNTP